MAGTIGIDFGTTNTVVALAGGQGPASLVNFPAPEGELFAFRSAISFHAPPDRPIRHSSLPVQRHERSLRGQDRCAPRAPASEQDS